MQQPPQPLQQALCSTAVAAAGGEGDGSLAPCLQGPAAQAPADQQREAPGEAQELAVELAAAAAAATGGPCQQAATDGSGGAGPASPAAEEDDEEEGVEDVKEDGEFDAELATWLAGRLQRMQPGAELTTGSVKVLGKLLVSPPGDGRGLFPMALLVWECQWGSGAGGQLRPAQPSHCCLSVPPHLLSPLCRTPPAQQS